MQLYVTFDFGKSWSLVDTYINQWDWGMASTASSHLQSSVFYTAYPSKTGQQYFKSTYDLSLFHTNRYGADKVILQQHSVAMLYMAAPDDILWVATYEPKHRSLNLYVSQDDGKTLIDTDFPEQLVEKVCWSDINKEQEFSNTVINRDIIYWMHLKRVHSLMWIIVRMARGESFTCQMMWTKDTRPLWTNRKETLFMLISKRSRDWMESTSPTIMMTLQIDPLATESERKSHTIKVPYSNY